MTNVLMALKDGSLMTVPCGSGILLRRGTMLLLSARRLHGHMATQAHRNLPHMLGEECQLQDPLSLSQPLHAEGSVQAPQERVQEDK